ncbi:MAG: pyridoxamine 5'-phosphate oxidase family protein [Candidatus Ancillula sp.]|jgi:uncharacterized pyridoxamine 5'-phosphate oxidase family protein|nr:pyridoxamine 5'-phosphate oxidase family protein [Candidatus Ancillula sp.]
MTNQEIYDYFQKCGTFWLATVNSDGNPQTRPFGLIMINDNKLYFSTGSGKKVYNEIIAKPEVQLGAWEKALEWVRVSGTMHPVSDPAIRQAVYDSEPRMKHFYNDPQDPNLGLLALNITSIEDYR